MFKLFLFILLFIGINTQNTTAFQVEYLAQSVKVFEDGKYIEGPDSINKYLRDNPQSIESLSNIFTADSFNRFYYEISSFTSDGDSYRMLSISSIRDKNKRALEFVAKLNPEFSLEEEIKVLDQRRAEWIELCNKDVAKDLVNELYSENTMYFNHRPVITGREALSREYAYMNNPNYELSLTPLHVEVVSPTLAFEIGQCVGSYPGKYMLVWQKADDGKWYILMDSNI